METDLTPDQEAFVRRAVEATAASIARGEGRTITRQSMRQLADEVTQRGRRRLATETSYPR
jgi:hypothetical protein